MISWLKAPESLSSLSDDGLRDAHLGLQGNLRTLRYAVPLLCFVIIAGFIFNMYSTYQAIKPEEVVAAFDKEAAHVLPKIQRSAMQVGERVAPKVSAAFAKQLDRAVDQLGTRLDGEMKKLGDELPKKMEGALNRRLTEANERQVKVLHAAFPELKKDPKRVQRLMASFQSGFSRWAQKTLTGTFARHLKELDNIKRTLNGFVAKQNAANTAQLAAGAKAGRHKAHPKITPEQLLALWLEIMDEALKSGGESDLLTAPAEGK